MKKYDFRKNRKAYKKYVDEYVSSWNNDLVRAVMETLGDPPSLVTTDDIIRFLPTGIGQADAKEMYESFYRDR